MVRSFRVDGGLVVVDNQLLMAANRRRQGTLERTPRGGAFDAGEIVTRGIEACAFRVYGSARESARVEQRAP